MSPRTSSAPALAVAAAAAFLLTACGGAGIGFGAEQVDPVGIWSESTADDSPFLSFTDDGRVSGFDGCNQLSGSWEATADGVEFGQLASTRMACPDVDTWLAGAATAEVSGGTMTVINLDGVEIGELKLTSETPAAE